MKTRISLSILGLLWLAASLPAQDIVFFTGFEYDDIPFVIEPNDMNGADDQVGEWSGDEFPEGVGDILELPDSAGIVPSPYGGDLFVLDRPGGDPDRPNSEPNSDFTGSYFAELSESVGLLGTEVSFQVGTRRTGGNHQKDYDIIGRDEDGNTSFHIRIGTNNNGLERIGQVVDDGARVVWDLPTVEGDDAPNDLDNTGGFTLDNGPGLNAEIADVLLKLSANGYTINFSYPEDNTSAFANAYITDSLAYNGDATELAQIEFTYEASGATGRNSGYILDEILVTSLGEILFGDFDSNGTIDVDDFSILAMNLGTGTEFGDGDFNFDGRVDLVDFVGLKAAFNAQPAGAAAVPEPTSAVLGLGLISLLCLRRRR